MKIKSSFLALVILPLISCCANANISKNREAYILSQPHGWIELSLTDTEIPAELPPKDLTEEQIKSYKNNPPSCYVSVKLNNEVFLRETIFPYGEEAPYIVDTGFRFPAPIGTFQLDFRYSGCNIENNQEVSESFSTGITIYEKMVSPITYDGISYIVEPIEENTVVTLEDIYRKIE